MDAKRTSEQIDGELQELRAKIRGLEAQKAEHVKALEKAKGDRKRNAYSAHGDGDAKAKQKLLTARTTQREAELALEDLESAIAEGRARFDTLQRDHEKTYRAEQWAALMAEAELARKEAAEIDAHINGFSQLLAAHGKRLEYLKNKAHNLNVERAFNTVGLRHVDRVLAWKMIQVGFVWDYEKPSEVYRKAAGYADILAEQIQAAKQVHERHVNGQDGEIVSAEPEAGAEAGTAA